MIKNRFFGLIAGLFAVAPVVVHAAYPVNQARTVAAASNGNVVYLPTNTNGVVAANANTAAAPTRVTGALPRVGTTATNAGRQYYQSADYERLADSGLYIGLSAAYTASTFGKISADYTGKAYYNIIADDVPGAFKEASWKHETVIPLQVSLGAAINSNLRVDFSYLRYSGLSYPSNVETGNGDGGFTPATVSGGAITANTAMLNVYYNIDSFTGYIAGGALRPYIGAGVGLSLNTIADYVVYDGSEYSGVSTDPVTGAEEQYKIYDIFGYHNGGTNEQLAFEFELGLTTDLSGGIKLDFFGRYVNLGRVRTSGSVVSEQTQLWETTGEYFQIEHITDWQESGRLSMIDVGARLRLQF